MRGLIQTQGLLHRSPGNAHGPGSAADRRVLSVYPQGSQDPLPCQGQWAPGGSAELLLEVLTFRRADGREVSLEEFPLAQTLSTGETVRAEEIVLQAPTARASPP